MDIFELLNHEKIEEFVLQYRLNKDAKKQASYNLFTISSYNSYLENFHSDIIASLLDPNGLHQEGGKFLEIFIEFLRKNHDFELVVHDFQNAIVTRETGRLDIWIRDEKSKQSIIIENKINNAADMDSQLDRYFIYSESVRNYKVKAVVYLSLDGTKKAPPTKENFGHLVRNIGAFTNQKFDLASGWLQPCLNIATNMDSSSVIHQYINLLQHLGNKNMDTKIMDEFYQFLSRNNGLETVNAISEMRNKITTYRADKFANSISDFSPFKNQARYRQNYWLYENYRYKNCNLKLDVWFEFDGSAYIEFWNPTIRGIEGRTHLTERLEAINLLCEFEDTPHFAGNGYHKRFTISESLASMKEIDTTVVEFVKKIMDLLRRL